MTPAEVVANLRVFNDWRRGELDDLSMPDPREIGEAIDAAIEMVERFEAAEKERDALRAKITEMKKQEPVRHEFQGRDGDWYPFINQRHYENTVADGTWPIRALYALPGAQAQNVPKAVAYLDIGAGGYMDIGTDLTDEALAALPKGRHMLGIVGTYGVDGYVPAPPAPRVPTALLVAVANLVAQMEIVSRVGFVDTPNDKDSCAAFCVAEGTWLELMSCVKSLASALAAAPEAKP